jgi:ABC-type multidrug transport system permease subunit
MNKKFFRLQQLWRLTASQFMEIVREPGVLFWGIIFPILMSLGLGVAFTQKADVLRKVAIIKSPVTIAADTTALSEFLINNCERNPDEGKDSYDWKLVMKDDKLGNSIFQFYEMDWQSSMMLLKRGTVNIILKNDDGDTEYHFDPMNPDAQLSYIKLNTVIGPGKVVATESNANIKLLTVTGTRYIDFLVPGLISMGVMMSCMWGISYGIIEKRSKKLLRRLVATPMKKSHFLIAMITVRISMNFVESAVLFLFALFVFDMVIQGDPGALILLFLAGNIAFSGLAVFVSSHTSNTEVGNGLINVVVMPMMVLSGIFFSYHNFPDWSIPVIQKFPLTMLTDGIRSIFNEGAGYAEVTIPILILVATGIIFFIAGLKIFKWH